MPDGVILLVEDNEVGLELTQRTLAMNNITNDGGGSKLCRGTGLSLGAGGGQAVTKSKNTKSN